MSSNLYILVLFIELLFFMGFSAVMISLLWSSFMGSPYVPTKKKEAMSILAILRPKKGNMMLELGCGDGIFLRTAVALYHVKGLGIDINPLIIFVAKIIAKVQKLQRVSFQTKNIFKTDLSQADYIYLFLMPKLLNKLAPKIKKQAKDKVVVISHGFKIEGWNDFLYKTILHKPFPTYFYRPNT